MELKSSSGASTSLHRTILGIIRNEMTRGAKGANGLTAAAVKKLLPQANSTSHQSASTEQITAALHSMTLWGKNDATLVLNGTKFKAISTAQAPPPRTTSPSPTPTVTGQTAGASSQINSPSAVTWENFGDAAPSPPQSKRPRHSAPRGSSSEPSPRNDHISSSSMRPTSAPTSKSPPAGGLPPKEAVLEVTSSSSADTAAAAAVLTIMRDNNGTTSSTSLEASIMTKVAEVYPDFSPSAFRRATKDLISKGIITTSPSRGNSRDRHLHITLDLTRASPKGPEIASAKRAKAGMMVLRPHSALSRAGRTGGCPENSGAAAVRM
ncbi:hypothetical protein T484DRAFT_1753412 [Baffinella frigidus]|nr:hypothetical protein T484DRAFT_1753412 [Cryptophyta sp. CCMP2293]